MPVETLVKTICLWVRCDAEACSTKEVHEGMPKIRMNCCPCSEVIVVGIPKREIQPVRRAEAQTLRGGINHWNCLGPAGVSVNASKQVTVAFGWR